MKIEQVFALAVCLWFCATISAAAGISAKTGPPIEVSANIGVDSVSVFRGIRSHRLNPSVYGAVDIDYGDFYAGAFLTPVAFGDETNALLLGYAGAGKTLLGVDFDTSVRFFSFPGSRPLRIDLDGDNVIDHEGKKGVFETYIGASKTFGLLDLSAGVFYSPDSLGKTDPAFYFAGRGKYELPHGFDVSVHYGVSKFSNEIINDEYDDVRIGLSKSLFGLDFGLSYSDTFGRSGAEDRVLVFSVGREFSIFSDEKRRDKKYRKIRNDWIIDKSIFGLAR